MGRLPPAASPGAYLLATDVLGEQFKYQTKLFRINTLATDDFGPRRAGGASSLPIVAESLHVH